VRKIFPFFDTKKPVSAYENVKGKMVFNTQIGLYPGIPGEIGKREYRRTIEHVRLFFEGKKKRLLKKLEKEMKAYAKEKEFESAAEIKRRLFTLRHIQDVALIKKELRKPSNREKSGGGYRAEAYDIAHISGTNMTGVLTVVEDGEIKKSEYRKFRIRTVERANDIAALKEVLRRRLNHDEWPLPKLIVMDGGKTALNAAEAVLKEYGMSIPAVSVVKDERHRPKNILGDKKIISNHEKAILLANSEAHRFALSYHRKLRKTGQVK